MQGKWQWKKKGDYKALKVEEERNMVKEGESETNRLFAGNWGLYFWSVKQEGNSKTWEKRKTRSKPEKRCGIYAILKKMTIVVNFVSVLQNINKAQCLANEHFNQFYY